MNRFSQKDTLRGSVTQPGSLNRYVYVQNDPVNFMDPSGMRQVAGIYGDGTGRTAAQPKQTTPIITKPGVNKPSTAATTFRTAPVQMTDTGTGSYTSSNNAAKQVGNAVTNKAHTGYSGNTAETYGTSHNSGSFAESPSVSSVGNGRGFGCGSSTITLDDRFNNGMNKVLGGTVFAGFGIAAVVVAGASAVAPPVAIALLIAGLATASTSYGMAEFTEGVNELSLVVYGDTTSTAYNPLRDTLFGQNQNAYDTYGDIGMFGSGVSIAAAPVWGNTGSGVCSRSGNSVESIRPKLKTDANTAFFWSGRTDGIGGEEIAKEIAQSRGGVTLESTIEAAGIDLPMWDASNESVVKTWEAVSNAYAEQVSGEVHAIIGRDLRPGNIWETIELPSLMNNPNVTRIITIDPKTMMETVIFER